MTPRNAATRAIGYLRVSTDEQAMSGLGMAAQSHTITRAVEARGWTLAEMMTDDGKSGGTMARPALTAALDALDAGAADVLVVAKIDRLSRSVLDYARITERSRRNGWSIVALDVDVDTSTPTGGLMANMTAAIAEWERQIISVRTIEALAAKRAAGARLGRPVTLPAEVRARIAAERAAGHTLQAIADGLTADGIATARGGKWTPATVRKVAQSVALDAEAAARQAVA
jgi:DNA invertase Pin-like site-specific DNA recombinase